VHCTGYGKNKDLAVPFWSTKDAGQQPFEFVIGQGNVIKAWDEGVATMKVIRPHHSNAVHFIDKQCFAFHAHLFSMLGSCFTACCNI
jgi:FKBP-type peptidyl-prolyl cis-trans isomerase